MIETIIWPEIKASVLEAYDAVEEAKNLARKSGLEDVASALQDAQDELFKLRLRTEE